VFATSVNRTDCGFLTGEPKFVRLLIGLTKPRQRILGCEFAGTVEAVGDDVTSFEVGQKVFGYDGAHFGGHAEYLTIRESGLVALMPAGLSYEEAAPITEGAHYALSLIRASGITGGQKVLVNGSTGAIGSAAVQLLKHIGANVTAVCDTKNLALVQSLGADRVIDYTHEDFTKLNDQFDVVLDAVGKSSFRLCKPLLKPRGIYLSSDLGPKNQNPFLALATRFSGGKRVMFPIPLDRKEDVLFLKSLVEAGQYRPVIDRRYSLSQIAEAYDYVESGQKTGNVVIRVVEGTGTDG
jgi:NADPH:quinone reductase-like Zn-dependent oxidoreductase